MNNNDDVFQVTERRLWNDALRTGLLEAALKEGGARIRTAFATVGREARTIPQVSASTGEILALSLAEIEARLRIQSAYNRKVWSLLLRRLPEDERRGLEHEIRTLQIGDISP
jgi:hypothetical protein